MESLSTEVLTRVFACLDLKGRGISQRVCRRWRAILNTLEMPAVTVFNIFETEVWQELSQDLRERFSQWIQLQHLNSAMPIMQLVGSVEIIKIWFKSRDFVSRILNSLRECGLAFNGLDIFPYHEELPLDIVHEFYPFVGSLTLRPHGKAMFSNGFHVSDFPQFGSLTTLAIENVYLGNNVVFPPNLTELEWTASRESSSSDASEQLCKLGNCQNLKYLLLAHTNFDTAESLTKFLQTISQLPQMMLIAFKFCRFKTVDFESEIQPLEALKAVKIDLCYGEVRNTISRLFALAPNLKLFSFECMLSFTAVQDAYHFMTAVYRRNMLFKFSTLQRFSSALDGERNVDLNDFTPPAPFQDIIGRLDLSFVTEIAVINCFIRDGWYARLQEFKAVRCDGITDATLGLLAQCCPVLSKVYLTGCPNVSVQGLLPFVAHCNTRRTRFLRVGVCGAGIKLADLCNLIDLNLEILLPDRKIQHRLIRKRLPEEKAEENYRLIVWEPATQKQLMFHDYPSNALSNLIGLVVLA